MKKYIQFLIAIIFTTQLCKGQETIYPAAEQKGSFYITHATIHVGNGQVINDGTIKVTNGKIWKRKRVRVSLPSS